MEYKYLGHKKYFLRFKQGDNFFEELTNFFELCDLKSAVIINAIGKCYNAKLGYFDEVNKKYCSKVVNDSCEIINISGSINYDENSDIKVHTHCTLSDINFKVYGGHLLDLNVGLTLEMFIQEIGVELVALKDKNVNLSLLEVNYEK